MKLEPSLRPWYRSLGDEIQVAMAAYRCRLPLLLCGPTGCGKTRFVENLSWLIARESNPNSIHASPLVTVACHDDLSAADLVGRFLLSNNSTTWVDGPLTKAARTGAICYLDEVVEARRDTTVVIHSLTDHRRTLNIEKTGETLEAHPSFFLVVSYNPLHHASQKSLKPSTRQRFIAMDFGYPPIEIEAEIVKVETDMDDRFCQLLAETAAKLRNLQSEWLVSDIGTRSLVHAAQLVKAGVTWRRACEVAIVLPASDDPLVRQALTEIIDVMLPA